MRLSIKLKLAFILAASALGMIGTIGAFTFLLRLSQNTLTAINAGTKTEFEVALNAVEQAAGIEDFTLKLVREKDLDNIESLMNKSEAATTNLRRLVRTMDESGAILASFDALAKA